LTCGTIISSYAWLGPLAGDGGGDSGGNNYGVPKGPSKTSCQKLRLHEVFNGPLGHEIFVVLLVFHNYHHHHHLLAAQAVH